MSSLTPSFCSAGGAGVQGGEDASGDPWGHQPVPSPSSSPSSPTPCLPSPCYGTPILPHASSLPASPHGWNAPTSSPTSPRPAQTESLPRYTPCSLDNSCVLFSYKIQTLHLRMKLLIMKTDSVTLTRAQLMSFCFGFWYRYQRIQERDISRYIYLKCRQKVRGSLKMIM